MNLRAGAKIWIHTAVALSLLALWSGIGRADTLEQCGNNEECLRQAHVSHAVKSADYWRAFNALPIDRRILVASTKLLDYLNLDNHLNGFPNRPRAAKPPRQFTRDLRDAVSQLPAPVLRLVDSRLMGIYLVEDLGGTGFTDYVYDEQGDPAGAFVVLDTGVLTQAANRWATWKENTPFIAEAGIELQAVIENAENDDVKQALQFIVLHEFGHVASVGRQIHPRWDAWDCVSDPPERYPYLVLSWQLAGGEGCRLISTFDRTGFGYRTDVVYYFGAELPASVSPEVYAQLEQTNFPSLYASTSPADDFAEAFAIYVHAKMMGKPFSITIDSEGRRETRFTACWDSARCAAKQEILTALLAGGE